MLIPSTAGRSTELVACLIAYTMDAHGRVRPQSTFRGFEDFSFGQKKQASPFATAKVLSVLAGFSELAEDVAVVDVLTLTSSKGGSGTWSPRAPADVPQSSWAMTSPLNGASVIATLGSGTK